MKDHGAAAISLDADWTPVLFAQSAEEADHFRVLLEAEGISILLGEAKSKARGASGIPVMVPADLHAQATEIVACKDATSADWDEDEDEDDDDFLDDDDDDDEEDEDEDEEDDDFLPDDDDVDEEEEFDADVDDE